MVTRLLAERAANILFRPLLARAFENLIGGSHLFQIAAIEERGTLAHAARLGHRVVTITIA